MGNTVKKRMYICFQRKSTLHFKHLFFYILAACIADFPLLYAYKKYFSKNLPLPVLYIAPNMKKYCYFAEKPSNEFASTYEPVLLNLSLSSESLPMLPEEYIHQAVLLDMVNILCLNSFNCSCVCELLGN